MSPWRPGTYLYCPHDAIVPHVLADTICPAARSFQQTSSVRSAGRGECGSDSFSTRTSRVDLQPPGSTNADEYHRSCTDQCRLILQTGKQLRAKPIAEPDPLACCTRVRERIHPLINPHFFQLASSRTPTFRTFCRPLWFCRHWCVVAEMAESTPGLLARCRKLRRGQCCPFSALAPPLPPPLHPTLCLQPKIGPARSHLLFRHHSHQSRPSLPESHPCTHLRRPWRSSFALPCPGHRRGWHRTCQPHVYGRGTVMHAHATWI